MNPTRNLLSPGGPAARTLADLGWPTLIGFVVVSALMWALLFWVMMRRTGSFAEKAPPHTGGGMAWVIIGGFAIPGIVFSGLFVATLGVMRVFPMDHVSRKEPEIKVVAHQWWWDVEYREGALMERFHDANEIHIPTGRPVEIELQSEDVIHSFWVPRLHGKVDLIPGLDNRIRIQADQPGMFAGECAEFCGLQHARMRFFVIAEKPADFDRWLQRARQPAAAVAGDSAQRGQHVFMSAACPMCHKIAGTSALATVGPELTHVGSRASLAAGWRPNNLATLHAWIVNAQSIKPGAKMPMLTQLTGSELHDLAAYLEALK